MTKEEAAKMVKTYPYSVTTENGKRVLVLRIGKTEMKYKRVD